MITIFFPSDWEKTKCDEWLRERSLPEETRLFRGYKGNQFWFTICAVISYSAFWNAPQSKAPMIV